MRASLAEYMRPACSRVMRASRSTSSKVTWRRIGKSRASITPGNREGHRATERNVSEELNDSQEGGESGFGDGPEDFQHALAAAFEREDVLGTGPAMLPIHAIPVLDRIEGIEERLVIDRAPFC